MDIKGLFQRKRIGFTLIELVIVLAIMTFISGSLFLSLRASDRLALQQGSYALQADFRYVQRMAIIEGKRWGIVFDIRGNQYHIVSTGPTQIEKTVSLQNGVKLGESSDVALYYLPRGTASQGFRVTLGRGAYWQPLTATVSGGRIEIKDMFYAE
jgi:prepilin-type N-terminal cleavage/methylation domain-containing protein